MMVLYTRAAIFYKQISLKERRKGGEDDKIDKNREGNTPMKFI